MKIKIALMLILSIFAVILFMPLLVNKFNGVDVSLSKPSVNASPSKAEVEEEMLIAGKDGSNVDQMAEDVLAGYKFAGEQKNTSHANCIIIENVSKRDGCHRYVNDQHLSPPYFNPENYLDNMSSNQCRNETTAYYESVEKDMRLLAMAESVLNQLKLDRQSELKACSKYPPKALGIEELQPIVQRIEQAGEVTQEDLRTVLLDIAGKREFADVSAREEHAGNIYALFADVDETNATEAVNCDLCKQQIDFLSEALNVISEFKNANLELWSSTELHRKILVWKSLLLKDDAKAAACETATEKQ